MWEAREVRARARELREQRGALEARLAAGEGDARALGLELARVKEELADCAHRLKELEPRHRVRHATTWAGVDGWRWDRLQYKTWAELEGAEEPEGPTAHDRMRLAARTARARSPTEKQGEYLGMVEEGRSAAQAAREAGRDPSAVARTLRRGKARIARDAKALFAVLEAQEGPGPLVLDLARPSVLGAVLTLLTPRQQLYLYLYYGEWLSLREIGRLLRVDHASVLRSIRCGLERLEAVTLGAGVEVRGLEALEETLTAHFQAMGPEEAEAPPRPKAPAAAAQPRRPMPAHPLRALALRLVRGGEARTAQLGEGLARTEGPRWGSGRLLAALEEWVERIPGRGREKESRRQKLGRLLVKILRKIREELIGC